MTIAIITTQPINKLVAVGGSFTIQMAWTGVWPATAKWYHNGIEVVPNIPSGWIVTKAGGGVPVPNGALTLTRNGMTLNDYGNYTARIENSAPDTGYAETNIAIVTNTVSRLTQIAAEIKTLIGSMTIAGGYYNNWGSINKIDAALATAWPRAEISYELQEAGGDLSHYYGMLNAEFTIEVEPKIIPSGTVNSVLDVNAYMDTALADLIKLFFQNNGYLPLSGEAVVTFKSAERERDLAAGDVFRPGKLVTKWNVHYHNS